jgi:hypothetical protein
MLRRLANPTNETAASRLETISIRIGISLGACGALAVWRRAAGKRAADRCA